MNKLFYASALFLASILPSSAQQVAEKLNRAPVAVKTSQGILVSWRSLISDSDDTSFNVYRNENKIASNVSTKTNYLDKSGKPDDSYRIEVVNGGSATESCETTAWDNMFTTLRVNRPKALPAANGAMGYYRPDDISVGDLDGDGDYELVLKWMPSNQQDNGSNGYTSPCIIDAYEMDGTQLWRINLGLNIRSGNHYTQFLVYDFDGDGKAEMICKTAPGSVDGAGNYVSLAGTTDAVKNVNNSKTYVNSNGHVNQGEEFLTVFNGETGAAMHTIFYSPAHSGQDFVTAATTYGGKSIWGDTNLNRGNRYNAAVAYLDGTDHLPSAIMQRGYYTRCYLWAVDWNGTTLSTRWLHRGTSATEWSVCDTDGKQLASGSGKSSYGQGVHSISVGDVDGDGKDDIVIGSATISHEGKLLCSTGMGHGDAIHLADLCPERPGLEIMMPHEESPYGYDVHDATTGEILTSVTGTADNGRGLACDFIPKHKGYEFWSSHDNNTRSCSDGTQVLGSKPDTNFRIYWTGDPYDQSFDGRYDKTSDACSPRIRTYDSSNNKIITFQEFAKFGSPATCNTTKATPCLQADLLGDWREEIIMYQHEEDYSSNECVLMIFSTPEPTEYKVPCLMQDHLYRMGIAWQNSSYNQPPHLGINLPEYLDIKSNIYKTQTTSHAPEGAEPEKPESGSESLTIPSADKGIVTGTCYTAGKNGEITNTTSGNYIKVRTGNNDNTITFTVNSGYIITGITITAYSNNTSTTADRSIDLTGIYIDDSTESEISSAFTFPGGTAGQTPKTIEATGFAASKQIVLSFDNSKIDATAADSKGKNKQLQAIITFSYAKDTSIEAPSSQPASSTATYSLSGQQICTPRRGSIFIRQGKKYIK